MLFLLVILHGVGAYTELLERGLIEFGERIGRCRQIGSPRLPLPKPRRRGDAITDE